MTPAEILRKIKEVQEALNNYPNLLYDNDYDIMKKGLVSLEESLNEKRHHLTGSGTTCTTCGGSGRIN